jgi:phosphate transport system substrate-binding protein
MQLRVFAAAIIIVNIAAVSGALALDQNLPPYQAVPGISGQIKSVGSDTLKIEMTRWAKGFKDLYPGASIDIESKGSATAPPALLEGIAQFAPMSRPMTAEEIDAFKKKYGYQASGFRVAVDALAVYVNKDNPIKCLTLPQLNRIFSSTYKSLVAVTSKPGVRSG